MGAAAYNRGTSAIIAMIDREARPLEFMMIEDLNALPKRQGAPVPFGPVHFETGPGGWWAVCPVTGFGYGYRTLRQAVAAWRVTITECRGGVFIGEPSA